MSSIIATATNLAPGATGIPIGDIPTTAVVSFDPTAVPTSLLPTGYVAFSASNCHLNELTFCSYSILPSIVSEVTQLPTVIPTSAINPLDLCPCASLVLEAQAAGMIPLPVVTGTVSASAGVTLGARDLTQQPAVAQATEEPCPFAEQKL